jgi:hypothetical protein
MARQPAGGRLSALDHLDVLDLVLGVGDHPVPGERKILEGQELETILDLPAMTELGVPGGKGLPGGG